MSFSNLRQSVRVLFKEKKITLINTGGLAISLACVLFMLLWVMHELSYDRFHEDYRQLFRVEEDQYYSGREPYHVTVTPYVSGPVWKDEIPEIAEQCRVAWTGGLLFRSGEQAFFENSTRSVDSSFLEIFNFPLKAGDRDNVLRNPNSMILTEEMARKYFGDGNPLGMTISVNDERTFTVEGVLEKLPDNSVIEFSALVPWSFIEGSHWYVDSWGTNSISTFVKLQGGSVDTVVNRKITEVTDKYAPWNTIDFMVAPLHRIHLHQYFGYGESPGAVIYVYVFSAIALFLLLIACINFINLSTARSSIRAREISLRKINGASRANLLRLHMFESFIQTCTSVILAFLLVLLFLNKFNQITGKDIMPGDLLGPGFIIGTLAVLVVTTLLGGSYPSFYLSAMKPLFAFRGRNERQGGSGMLRKILVVFQFSLAVILIAGTMVTRRQLNYMRNADLGFDQSGLLHIQLQGNLHREYEMLREELTRLPGIVAVTASIHPPYQIGSNSGGIQWEGKDPEMRPLVSLTGVHYDFIRTMGIHLGSGRDFTADYPSDMLRDTTCNFIVNQTLAGLIGAEEVLGMEINFMGARGSIVGIMEDYHFHHLSNQVEPLVVAPVTTDNLGHMIIRLAPGNADVTLRGIEEKWKELLPDYPLTYEYVEEAIDAMYGSEARMASLIGIFSLVAIIIAASGLFALASFTAERRIREIGIRKTFGAADSQISGMMIRDFSLYIGISLVISLPLVWFIARSWLDDFHFRIPLKADLFLLTAVITTAVSVLTVLYHSLRAARIDPVEALRYE